MKKVRIGIFGLTRGSSFINVINGMEDAELVSVFDRKSDKAEYALSLCEKKTKLRSLFFFVFKE